MKPISKREKEILIQEFKISGNKHRVKYDPKQGYITQDFCKVFSTASISKKSRGKSYYAIDRFADLAKRLIQEGVSQ